MVKSVPSAVPVSVMVNPVPSAAPGHGHDAAVFGRQKREIRIAGTVQKVGLIGCLFRHPGQSGQSDVELDGVVAGAEAVGLGYLGGQAIGQTTDGLDAVDHVRQKGDDFRKFGVQFARLVGALVDDLDFRLLSGPDDLLLPGKAGRPDDGQVQNPVCIGDIKRTGARKRFNHTERASFSVTGSHCERPSSISGCGKIDYTKIPCSGAIRARFEGVKTRITATPDDKPRTF